MAQKNTAALNSALASLQPDNNSNFITPAKNREAIGDSYDSAWNNVDYPDLNNPQGTNKEYFYINSDQYRVRVNITTNEFEYSFDSGVTWNKTGGPTDTGVFSYVGATQASSTEINIGAVVGYIVDNESNPGEQTVTRIEYAGETNKTVTTLGSGIASYVLLDQDGVIVFQNTFPTSAQKKTHIYLSKIGHPTGTINTVGDEPDSILSPLGQLRTLSRYIGFINNGVSVTANGANLNINLNGGTVYRQNGNFVSDNTNPSDITIASSAATSFLYRTQTGAGGGLTTSIVPGSYDVAGTITAIPGSTNQATNQRFFLVPGLGLIVQYGQTIYATLVDAVAAINNEPFTVYPSLTNNAILIGILSIQKGATALNNTAQARFFPTDKWGQVAGATAGFTTATLQSAYNNSLQPEIITTAAGGAVQVKRGSALDTDNIFEWMNGAGSVVAYVNGNGEASFLNLLNQSLAKIKPAVGGTANAITATFSPTLTAYPNLFILVPTANNTGAVTIKNDALSLVGLKRNDGTDLVANDLTNQPYLALFDGTNYRIPINVPSQVGVNAFSTVTDGLGITINANSRSGIQNFYLDTAQTSSITFTYSNFVDGSCVILKVKKQTSNNVNFLFSTATIGFGNITNNSVLSVGASNSYFEIIIEARNTGSGLEYYGIVSPF